MEHTQTELECQVLFLPEHHSCRHCGGKRSFRKVYNSVSRRMYYSNTKPIKTESHADSKAESHLETLKAHSKTNQNRKPESLVLRKFSKTFEDIQKAPNSVLMKRL